MNETPFSHRPVLLKEVVSFFSGRPLAVFVDGTVGSGGHAQAILSEHSETFGIGLDVDKDMIQEARSRLRPFGARCRVVHANYADVRRVLDGMGIAQADGILLDLGVSSRHLDSADRGFSFRGEGRLDMRFDTAGGRPAGDVINSATQNDMEDILRRFGEVKPAKRLASAIVKARQQRPLESTADLEAVVRSACPGPAVRQGLLARVFQAFRIFVNQELENVQKGLPEAFAALKPGGRMAVISFHSLEDRMVKNFFRDKAGGCRCPAGLPVCACGRRPEARVLTSRAVVAGHREQRENPRSRSARLRAAEKIF